MILSYAFRITLRLAFVAFLAGTVAMAAPAQAQSSSSITVNGVEITITGGSSQSISTTSTGAEIVLDGRTIVIDDTTISVDGSSMDSGPFESVEIIASGNSLTVNVDGETRFSSTTSTSDDADEGSRLTDLGVDYYRGDGVEQDYLRALELFKEAFNTYGETTAGNNLAIMYWWGENGIPQDRVEALKYARAVQDEGFDDALYFIATDLIEGISTDPDPASAIEFYERAVEAGSLNAMVDLGNFFKDGEHVAQDYVRANTLYKQAADEGSGAGSNNYAWSLWNGEGLEKDAAAALPYAETGHAEGYNSSTYLLGLIHDFGRHGVPINDPLAVKYYTEAAEKGHASAAFNLSFMYRDGEGVEADLLEAIRWMRHADDLGYQDAPDQITKLEQMAAEAGIELGSSTPQEPVYWYAIGQDRFGPMTLGDLQKALDDGTITLKHYVWKEGLETWIYANDMDELNK